LAEAGRENDAPAWAAGIAAATSNFSVGKTNWAVAVFHVKVNSQKISGFAGLSAVRKAMCKSIEHRMVIYITSLF
jgi:hypothetical protein